MNPLRSIILAAAGNTAVRNAVVRAPISGNLVRRFVAGENTADAVGVTSALVADGLHVTLDYLGEDAQTEELAEQTVKAYEQLLGQLHAAGLGERAEVSVKLSAIGQQQGEQLAVHNASRICLAAERAGTTVTLDAESHFTTDSTLRVLAELRRDWPSTGAVLQAYLRRTLDDCRALTATGSRVRLCKGAYDEPEAVALGSKHEVDLSFVRCANVLLEGNGYPMFATHDPTMINIVGERARWYDRKPGSFEFQMLYGVRPDEQTHLAEHGHTMRVYVPYGVQSYGYLMRRLAERPSNVAFFLRAVAGRG